MSLEIATNTGTGFEQTIHALMHRSDHSSSRKFVHCNDGKSRGGHACSTCHRYCSYTMHCHRDSHQDLIVIVQQGVPSKVVQQLSTEVTTYAWE